MEAVLLIHGITGSKLSQKTDGDIWPPDVTDLLNLSYSQAKFDILLNQSLKVTGIIDSAMGCLPVYEPIESDLKDICANYINAQYDVFCYDWRQNVLSSMQSLATQLEITGSKASITSITLICHSLGGLVARLLLESGKYNSDTWFAKIKRVMFVCTPHLGAPVALTEFLGLKSVDLVSAADVQLGAQTWESAYQLLPAPNSPNAVILDDGIPEDFYQQDVAEKLGLDPAKLVSITKSTFGMLDFNKRPSTVQYSFIVGTSHETDELIDIDSFSDPPTFASWTDNQGDGTVPIWSAGYTGGTGVPTMIPGDHAGVMATSEFQLTLYNYFGVSTSPEAFHATHPTAVVSLNRRVFRPEEKMSVLIIPDVETDQISATLKLSQIRISRATGSLQTQIAPFGPGRKIVYQGGSTKFIRMTLTAPTQPGAYRLDLEGKDATHFTTARTAGRFAVVKN